MVGEKLQNEIQWDDVEWVILPSEGMSNVLLETLARSKGILCRNIPSNEFIKELTNKIVLTSNIAKNFIDIEFQKVNEGKINENFEKYSIDHVVFELYTILTTKKG